jgi:two-component system, response regulator
MSDKRIEVLLIEDNPDDAELVIRVLKKNHPTIHLEVVQEAVSALDFLFSTGKYAHRLTASTPALVLLDLHLPGNGGLSILRVMKAYARTKGIPVVVFTGSPDDKTRMESYQWGANSYVVKPTDFTEFQRAVQDIGAYWLGRNDGPPATLDNQDNAEAFSRDGHGSKGHIEDL